MGAKGWKMISWVFSALWNMYSQSGTLASTEPEVVETRSSVAVDVM